MPRALQWKILFIVGLIYTVSCGPTAPTPVPISTFTDPDPELTEAVRQAQDTLHILRQAFLARKPSYVLMSLKVRFSGNGEVEDMWTEPVDVLDGIYLVRMVEGVTLEQGVHPDRLIEVEPQNVVDWMILEEDGNVIGGYTLRLEYERLTPEEQKKYREVTGYKFE